MQLQLISEPESCLGEYELVPIAFEVTERFELFLEECGLGGLRFYTRAVEPSYIKDYDRLVGCRPCEWANRWDLRNWWFAAAFLDSQRVGGAAVVFDPSDIEGLPMREDTALLWDIRIHPQVRHQGIGSQLITFVEEYVRKRGIHRIAVETQNINVAACRFYARAGYVLVGIRQFAYAKLPDEVQLIWEKDLV